MPKAIESSADFFDATATPGKLVVIDFWASWCQPCVRFAPAFEALAAKYPHVAFFKAQSDGAGSAVCQEQGIRSLPTIRFFIAGQQKGEVVGGNPSEVERLILELSAQVPQAYGGEGHSLGGGAAAPLDAAAAREARLRRFGAGGGGGGGTASSSRSSAPAASAPMEEDADLQAALAMSMASAAEAAAAPPAAPAEPTPADGAAVEPMHVEGREDEGKDGASAAGTEPNPEADVEMVLPAVDETLLAELVSMGFPDVRARKALLAGQTSADNAINWMLEHGEDADIDDPIPLVPKAPAVGGGGGGGDGDGKVVRSWKCVETGRLFRTQDELMMYAEKTGRSNFEESSEEKKPLTPEQVAEQKALLKARLAARRAERGEAEKAQTVDREKARRTMGKEMNAMREKMEQEKRQREYRAIRKEKEDAKRERERLRAELAKDKAERKSRGGKLAGRLSADGYNPAGLSAAMAKDFDAEDRAAAQQSKAHGEGSAAPRAAATAAAASGPPREETVDKAIASISNYKVGGDGGKCLKVLLAYTTNLVKDPDDERFRHIKLDNNAFRTKVAPLRGGVSLLKAVGFVKDDDAGLLEIAREAVDVAFVEATKLKLSAAYQQYTKANG